jgi:oligopeptide/dipeptide ABC transporter ATP-binding protein
VTSLLAVEDVSLLFPVRRRPGAPPIRAVDGVSFELERGESLALVGESGSGKSTLARLAVGLLRPTSGRVLLDGADLAGLRPAESRAVRRRVQMVFQDPYSSLDPRQTVRAIVEEPLVIHRAGKPRERRVRVLELLDAVGLPARALALFPHEFSGGQRQRIGIARALALAPELLVCDEPVSALDVSIRAQVLGLFRELRERFALSYLFISHDLAAVRAVATHVAVMVLGRLVERSEADAHFAAPAHPYAEALLAAVPRPYPDTASGAANGPARDGARPRVRLRGDPPDPAAPPPGCAFHPRCPLYAATPDPRCERERPALVALSAERTVACHLRAPADVGGAGQAILPRTR